MHTVITWEDCERCVTLSKRVARIVMCRQCRKAVLPQLAQPGWYRLVGQMHAKTDEELASTPAKKAIRRNAQKLRRLFIKESESHLTPAFCLNGCGQPVNVYGQYCGPCRAEAVSYGRRTPNNEKRAHYSGLKAS